MEKMNKLRKIFLFLNKTSFVSLEEKILKLFKNFPMLPSSIIEFLVSFGPYLVLLGGIFSILSVFSLFSLGTYVYYRLAPFASVYSVSFYISIIGSVISGLMMIASFNDLKGFKLFGWRLLFWSANVGILVSLISLRFFGAILSGLISWYLLSQIRIKYK